MFEAGALSKNIEKSKVVPLLFGIEPSDIQGPLVQFQAAKFSKTEMKKVVKMVNSELGDLSLTTDVIDNVFDMWWPKLEAQIKEAEEKAKTTGNKDLRSERDLIEEVLSLTRELSINRRFERERGFNPRILDDLISTVERLTEAIYSGGNLELLEYLKDLHRPLEYLIEETMNTNPGMRKDIYSRYRRAKMLLDEILILPDMRNTARTQKSKSNSELK